MSLGISEKEAQVQVLSLPGARRVKVRVGRPGAAMPAPSENPAAAPSSSPAQAPAPLSKPAEYQPKVSQRKQPSAEQAESARRDLEALLEKMGVPSTVELKEHAGNTVFNVKGDKEALLIGKRGATADALQDALNAMLASMSGDKELFAVVDVDDYRLRQERKIMDKARDLAELVLKEGGQQAMGPLSAAERRLVHLELKPMEGVETYSVGQGSTKKVVIQKKG
jgi:spoIIIJ-associated protein